MNPFQRHPLCLALVRKKWMRYGKMSFFFLYLLPYVFFLTFLTTFVLTSPNPITNPQYYNCTEYFHNQTQRPILNETMSPEVDNKRWNDAAKWGIWTCTVFFLLIDILQEKHNVLIKAILYFDFPWSIVINYVLYGLVIYVTIQAEGGYDILDGGVVSDKLRSVCLIVYNKTQRSIDAK